MKKQADQHRGEVEEYRVGDMVLLSTKDLKWQMVGRRTDKLTERFVGPYRVKGIISLNAIELDLPSSIDGVIKVNRGVSFIRNKGNRHKSENCSLQDGSQLCANK